MAKDGRDFWRVIRPSDLATTLKRNENEVFVSSLFARRDSCNEHVGQVNSILQDRCNRDDCHLLIAPTQNQHITQIVVTCS